MLEDHEPGPTRRAARISIGGAVIVAVIWLSGMTTFALTGPGLTGDFRAHLLFGLGMFAVIILGPLLLVWLTLSWVVRRIAGTIILLLFFGMARGGISQGFGLGPSAGIILVCAVLVGTMLFFLSRPPVMSATADGYDFLSLRDIFSRYTFGRKPIV